MIQFPSFLWLVCFLSCFWIINLIICICIVRFASFLSHLSSLSSGCFGYLIIVEAGPRIGNGNIVRQVEHKLLCSIAVSFLYFLLFLNVKIFEAIVGIGLIRLEGSGTRALRWHFKQFYLRPRTDRPSLHDIKVRDENIINDASHSIVYLRLVRNCTDIWSTKIQAASNNFCGGEKTY